MSGAGKDGDSVIRLVLFGKRESLVGGGEGEGESGREGRGGCGVHFRGLLHWVCLAGKHFNKDFPHAALIHRLQNSYTASQRANQDLEEKLHALVSF